MRLASARRAVQAERPLARCVRTDEPLCQPCQIVLAIDQLRGKIARVGVRRAGTEPEKMQDAVHRRLDCRLPAAGKRGRPHGTGGDGRRRQIAARQAVCRISVER